MTDFPDPSEFPNYDQIDSESVVEPADGYDDEQADHDAEPDHEELGGEQ